MADNAKLTRAADNIRVLAASMVEKAKSGHPGGAMGGADFINVLYTEFLRARIPEGVRSILDVGCGGGFPSVPLAILFPEAHFTAVDSIGKKIKVVQGVAEGLGLANLTPLCARAETLPERYDYVVSRAVTEMPTFVGWVWDKIDRGQKGALPNGILYLKGGDLTDELARTRQTWREYPISAFFDEEFFETKKVVYTSR